LLIYGRAMFKQRFNSFTIAESDGVMQSRDAVLIGCIDRSSCGERRFNPGMARADDRNIKMSCVKIHNTRLLSLVYITVCNT
jgi:hypothetical protein